VNTPAREDASHESEPPIDQQRPRYHRWLLVAACASPFIAAGIVAILAPENAKTISPVTWFFAIALINASIYALLRLRGSLGVITATLAIAIVWAVLAFVVAMAVPHCPAAVSAHPQRCNLSQGFTQAGIGLLLPVIPLIAILPAIAGYKSLRGLFRYGKGRIQAASSTPPGGSTKRSDQLTRAKRTTPKGTQPATPRKTRKR